MLKIQKQKNPEKRVSTPHGSGVLSQNIVLTTWWRYGIQNPTKKTKLIVCLPASLNITFCWNMLSRFGDIQLTDELTWLKTLLCRGNKAKHMVLIPSVVSCHICYIWMDKFGRLLSKYFFFTDLVFWSIFLHPAGCAYSREKWQMHCVVIRSCTQHGCWWGYWILLSFWICICTWCLGFPCVKYPFPILCKSLVRTESFLQEFCLCMLYFLSEGR